MFVVADLLVARGKGDPIHVPRGTRICWWRPHTEDTSSVRERQGDDVNVVEQRHARVGFESNTLRACLRADWSPPLSLPKASAQGFESEAGRVGSPVKTCHRPGPELLKQ